MPVLKSFCPAFELLHVYSPGRQLMPAKLRAFLDFAVRFPRFVERGECRTEAQDFRMIEPEGSSAPVRLAIGISRAPTRAARGYPCSGAS